MCDDGNGKSSKSDDENELSASDESEPEEVPSSAPFDPELDGEEDDGDDDENVVENVPQEGQKGSTFSLKGGSTGFSSRSHSIFDCLDNMAKMTSSSLGQDNVIDGVFARPVAPPPSRKTSHPPSTSPTPAKKLIPDYMVNPDRWTRYSLEDVAETSDQGNSRVAHQFLASLLQKKDEPVSRDYISQEKIIFSKPHRIGMDQSTNKLEKEDKEKSMRLSHLEEEEEEDEEDKNEVERKQEKNTKKDGLHINKQTGVKKGDADVAHNALQANSEFVAFKKTNRKMYRKGTEDKSHN